MIHLVLPDSKERRLPFYLAMEEWAAAFLPASDYFFTWIVAPTVIIGRNQDVFSEVNLAYCREHGIDVCRRRSGGGCVYADRSNIMISYITPSVDVVETFAGYTSMVARQLSAMGIPAEPTGRNDITVGGRKISGNAFYHVPGRSIVHGTMLYDTDVTNMLNAITPSRAKLESKQVKSVESRITMARQLLPDLSFDDFHARLTAGLETSRRVLTPAEVDEIAAIEQSYYQSEWLLKGKSGGASSRGNMHIDGVGQMSASLRRADDGSVDGLDLTGDMFVIGNMDEVEALLKGATPDAASLALRLADIDMSRYIAGLTTPDFVELLAQTPINQ